MQAALTRTEISVLEKKKKKTTGPDVLSIQRMLSALYHGFKGKDKGICGLCTVDDWADLADMQSSV